MSTWRNWNNDLRRWRNTAQRCIGFTPLRGTAIHSFTNALMNLPPEVVSKIDALLI
jgi:hypothetical protein